MPLPHTPANKRPGILFFAELDFRSEISRFASGFPRKAILIDVRASRPGLARFRAVLVLAADQQCGNRMLENKLFLRVGLKHD
jgi:hypothetical protein